MSALAVLDRTLADSKDRLTWEAMHEGVIGSWRAGSFAKPQSVELYVRSILSPRTFHGNAATASGNRWEPLLLAWEGAEPNSLLVHHPDNRRFACTVDGTKGTSIVEAKAKHSQIILGPKPHEVRQIAWQLYCLPEYDEVRWTWAELVNDPAEIDGWRLRRDPQTLVFPRDHPAIELATALIVPIAEQVLEGLDAARMAGVPF